jgi:ribosomal protein S12 methylthiotransferase
MLIAQDTTYYGLDLYKDRVLAKLMKSLADVNGIDWVRLHYAFPAGFPMDVIQTISEHPNICNYIDMPLQHSSDKMLKLMRRGINDAKSRELINNIRAINPDIAIRTTMLVGHPGETEEDFDHLCRFIEDMKFDRLGVFTYSHEEGTHAHSMADDIPQEIKEERADTLMQIQEDISLERNKSKIGRVVEVLIDRIEDKFYVGRTEWDSPEVDNEVLIPIDNDYTRIGDFRKVKIEKTSAFDLYGIFHEE